MNEQLYANSVVNSSTALTEPSAPPIELIIFNIEEVCFGIPLAKVERVVDITNIHNDFSSLATVQLLDLHVRLFGRTLAEPTSWTIVKDAVGTIYGIPVDPVPTLALVPLDRIRLLPIDFRATSPLGIASHVAIVTESTRDLTIFILQDL